MCKNGNIRKESGKLDLYCKKIDNYESYLGKPEGIVTTVGQLNFFKWCLEKNVINYIVNNLSKIEKSMLDVSSEKKMEKKPEKSNVYKTVMHVTVKFN